MTAATRPKSGAATRPQDGAQKPRAQGEQRRDQPLWVPMPRSWWLGSYRMDGMAGTFVDWVNDGRELGETRKWPREAVLFHLRVLADQAIWDHQRFPSRYELARETGYSPDEIRTFLRNEQWWLTPRQIPSWAEVRPTKRTRGPKETPKDEVAKEGAAKEGAAKEGAAKTPTAPKPAETTPKRPMKTREAWMERVLERYPDLREAIPVERLIEFVRQAVLSIREDAKEWQWRASARPVLDLLALDPTQDLDELLRDITLVAQACRQSRQPIFERLVRGIGMPSPVDRSKRPFYVLRIEHWEERLSAAQRWTAAKTANAAADAAKASPIAPPDVSEAQRVWDELLGIIQTHGWSRWMTVQHVDGVLLADNLMHHQWLANLIEIAADLEHGPNWHELEVRELLTTGVRDRFLFLYEPTNARDGPMT